jgi:hypothetical protein
MLANVAHAGCCDPLQRDLRLLDAKHKEWNCSSINDVLRQLCVHIDEL